MVQLLLHTRLILRRPRLSPPNVLRRLHTGRQSVSVLGNTYPTDAWTNITPTVLNKLTARLMARPGHPLHTVRSLVEAHYPDFAHHTPGDALVSPARNFDDLGFPPDHPGRARSDSYYVNEHLMLRTHTSAHEVETFKSGKRKWLLSADVYRRDEIDATHYPVFHQMEGARVFSVDAEGRDELEADNARLSQHLARSNIVIEDVPHSSPANPCQDVHDKAHAELVALNLKLSLNSLMLKLFGDAVGATPENPLRVRWIEAYFPFTAPSFEVEVFFGGKWLEILGSGVVQQATLDKSNVPDNISWAFGLGLERIAMILYSIPDIRLFWSEDTRFISQFQPGKITTFKSYSKYPPCYKDASFWLPEQGLAKNDIFDLVRDIAGDLVEDVALIDEFTHPKTSRTSQCYRINYRSLDRSLTNAEINDLQERVNTRLESEFGVEIRQSPV